MKNKKWIIIIVIVIVIVVGIIIALGTLGSKTNNSQGAKYGSIDTNIKEYPCIFEGKNLGKYEETTYNAINTSNKQIFKFFNDVIKKRLVQDNYFLLIDGNQCILFSSNMGNNIQKLTYNTKNKSTENWEYNGIAKNGTMEWTKKPVISSWS